MRNSEAESTSATDAVPLDGSAAVGPGSVREPIAIIGIGCRFPGGANDPASFWQLLRNGVDAIGEVPPDRWSIAIRGREPAVCATSAAGHARVVVAEPRHLTLAYDSGLAGFSE